MSSRSLITLALVLLLLLPSLPQAQTPTASLIANASTYSPAGGNLTFTASMSYPGLTLTAIGWSIQLPENWTFVSQTASASTSPVAGDNFLEWSFSSIPSSQLAFSFTTSYPAGLSGSQTVSVTEAYYRAPLTYLSAPPVVLAAIPEPSTYALIVGAIAFVGVIIARRRRAVAAPKA